MAARKRASGRKAARKKAARSRSPKRGGARKRAATKVSRKRGGGRRTIAVSIDRAIDALFGRGDRASIRCVGILQEVCCENWAGLKPPLGKNMVALMEKLGLGDKLDEEEKELIRKWPEHQLAAIVDAIKGVCAEHKFVHPALKKKKRKGPHGVVISITEPDSEEDDDRKKAPVKVVFQHPDFKY